MVGVHRLRHVHRCAHPETDRVVFVDGEQHCLRCGNQLQGAGAALCDPPMPQSRYLQYVMIVGAAAGFAAVVVLVWLFAETLLGGLSELRDQLLDWPNRLRPSPNR